MSDDMSEWQPIATLPEDVGWGGSDVVLWNPCDGLDVPPFAEPRDVYDKIREGKKGYTHWRRLVRPPRVKPFLSLRGYGAAIDIAEGAARVGLDEFLYRPPPTFQGSESLEAQLRRKRGEPSPPLPSEPFPTGNPPPWLVAAVMGGTFLTVGLAIAYAIISRG